MILTLLIFVPAISGLLILSLPKDRPGVIRGTALIVSLAALVVSALAALQFDPASEGMQLKHTITWIPSLHISYAVGIDGFSLLLILLTTFLMPLAILASWNAIEQRVREYMAMLLFLETGMIGVFCSLDMFLFYVFWEAMLIPMYFIIGIWGGSNRIYASVKFFLYTMFGSLLMLVAILAAGSYASHLPGGSFTTSLEELQKIAPGMPGGMQLWLFLAFALSFAIKVPLFPFHTWLPDAHVEAPTAGSVILAGVLLKMGTYGFLRFCIPLFPDATLACLPYISTLAVIGIVYGALVSMVQTDMKKLVAYSSVSHLGFVVLGIFALTEEGIQGSMLQMVNHGLSTGALFLLVGMIYERRHTRLLTDFGGLSKVMPVMSTILMVVSLSSVGLPGLNGFIGEFLILLGTFKSPYVSGWVPVVAATGVIFAAVYLLWMVQRIIFGVNANPANQHLNDLSAREWAILVPILVFIVWIGVYPKPFLNATASATRALVTQIHRHEAGAPARAAAAEVSPPVAQ